MKNQTQQLSPGRILKLKKKVLQERDLFQPVREIARWLTEGRDREHF